MQTHKTRHLIEVYTFVYKKFFKKFNKNDKKSKLELEMDFYPNDKDGHVHLSNFQVEKVCKLTKAFECFIANQRFVSGSVFYITFF